MYPQHENAHYKRTGTEDSAGLVGLSVKEAEQINKDNNRRNAKCKIHHTTK